MRYAALVFSLLIVAGCATTPQLSPQQRRALQSRTFQDTNMNNVFRAFKTVLQDEGYVIKNQDMAGGLIVAEIQKTDDGSAFWAALAGSNNYRTGQTFELSVNLEAINKSTVETRLVVQEKSHMSMGGAQGKEILDAKLYQTLLSRFFVSRTFDATV